MDCLYCGLQREIFHSEHILPIFYDIFSLEMQTLKDPAPETGHSLFYSNPHSAVHVISKGSIIHSPTNFT